MIEATAAGGEREEATPDLADIAALLAPVLAGLSGLREAFDAKIRYDEVRERQIDALHSEVEKHRQGLYRQLLRPVLTDLVGLHDDVAKLLSDQDAPGNADRDDQPAALVKAVALLRDSIEEALLRNGVRKFVVEGDHIDRARQRVIEVTETGQPELDRRVAHRLRPGFELDGKVLRPEWIVAYRYVAGPEASPEPATDER